MCGINGFNFKNEKLAVAMNTEIIHRGPDNQSVWSTDKLTFGHVRLSIIDTTDAGNQPFHYKCKGSSYVMVFNGEIYNYIEVRETLKKQGYIFYTQCDTEVILAAYDYWGEDCVNQFNGMWAFCIYNPQTQVLFCSRDRLGVKPFYYYFKDGIFIFSSELKGILQHAELNINIKSNICAEAVELYFSCGFIPSPLTIFNNVSKLNSSYNLLFDLNKGEYKTYRYFKPEIQKVNYDKKTLTAELDYLFKDSIKLRMRSDVPVGSFLSGGIDSTGIVYGILKQYDIKHFHTFSVGFEGRFDETSYINMAANELKNVTHHHEYYHKYDWKENQENYAFVYDEPFGDYSGYPTMYVSKMAKKHVTVVQSGDGGDEIFGGYEPYSRAIIIDRVRLIPAFLRKTFLNILNKQNSSKLRPVKEALKLSLLKNENFISDFLDNERYISESFKKWSSERLKECLDLTNNNLSEGLRMFDLLYYSLADKYLTKVDKASMYNSIEVRSPFLDYRLIEFSLRIPTELKCSINNNKILLKEYFENNLPNIPSGIIHRKKQGFTPPLRDWIQDNDFISVIDEYLETFRPINEEIYQFIKRIKNQPQLKSNLEYLIRFQIFINWYNKWVRK
ncbi:MAG: asparagine synthase (glutamine-hydrolyzing) [Bacteroidia bacterium]|nr:asparagine synthase (glutamine-hydrolyzing) [Bacteroidia bacterium]